MTEKQWFESEDVDLLIRYAMTAATEEQLRRFACACCRRIWHLITDERSRKAVELAELYAQGKVSADRLYDANSDAKKAWIERSQLCDDHAAAAAYFCSISKPTLLPAAANRVQAVAADKEVEKRIQASLLKEVVGNPFSNED